MKRLLTIFLLASCLSDCLAGSWGIPERARIHSVVFEELHVSYREPAREFEDLTVLDPEWITSFMHILGDSKPYRPDPRGGGASFPARLCSVRLNGTDGREVCRLNMLDTGNIIFLRGQPRGAGKNAYYVGMQVRNDALCGIVYETLNQNRPAYIAQKRSLFNNGGNLLSGQPKKAPREIGPNGPPPIGQP